MKISPAEAELANLNRRLVMLNIILPSSGSQEEDLHIILQQREKEKQKRVVNCSIPRRCTPPGMSAVVVAGISWLLAVGGWQ